MPGRRLPHDRILAMYESGLTPTQIAEALNAEDPGLDVRPEAVSMVRHRLGAQRQHRLDRKATGLLPWEIREEHRKKYPHKMLINEAAHRQGEQLDEYWEKKRRAWLARLQEKGLVVHYEPETEQGWFYVSPRQGVDLDIIREPPKTVK